jgi:pectate lyase
VDEIVEVRESATEVTFSNFTFEGGGKAQLSVQNGAKVFVTHCRFDSSLNNRLVVLNNSNVEISNLEFQTAQRFTIYVFMS